jgi:hypothetical protein
MGNISGAKNRISCFCPGCAWMASTAVVLKLMAFLNKVNALSVLAENSIHPKI